MLLHVQQVMQPQVMVIFVMFKWYTLLNYTKILPIYWMTLVQSNVLYQVLIRLKLKHVLLSPPPRAYVYF